MSERPTPADTDDDRSAAVPRTEWELAEHGAIENARCPVWQVPALHVARPARIDAIGTIAATDG